MRVGKLSNQDLQRLVLSKMRPSRREIIQGAGVGEDCAAIEFGNELCVLSTDPITATQERIGHLAVHVTLNDAAAAGATPIALMMTLLCPPDATEEDLIAVIDEAVDAASSQGVDIVGGHTEVTDAVTRMVISSTVIARAKKDGLISAGGMQAGDALVLTKWAALEGTAILANKASVQLESILTLDEMQQAKQMMQMISVVPEGKIAAEMSHTHAMHDVTEGGVLGAAWEMAQASGLGVEIHLQNIPIQHVTKKICAHYNLDPLRLIASGAMLIATSSAENLIQKLNESGIFASVIGTATRDVQCRVCDQGRWKQLAPSDGDEIYKVE